MCEWSDKWLLRYNPDKCRAMRMGQKDKPDLCTYKIGDTDLKYTEEEKDLGVTVDSNLKFETHVNLKVNKANKIMGLIRRSFIQLDKTTFNRLFKALVRPHLEYAHTVWYPSLKKLKTLIENVQRRATKQLGCCKGLEYEDRLKLLDLPCLKYRRLRGDMIEVFKMFNEKYDEALPLPIQKAKDIHSRQTRGCDFNICKTKSTSDLRKFFLKNRAVNYWNELPTKVKEAPSIKSFEKRLDKYWKMYNIRYSFENCLEFEKQRDDPNYAGTGKRNLKLDKDDDLAIQAL